MAAPPPCVACGTPVAPGVEGLGRCHSCGQVFDTEAAAYAPALPPGPLRGPPAGLALPSSGTDAKVEITWWRAWGLKAWPAAVVTLLHLVLMGFGLWQGALGPVAFLALMVAIQLFLYRRVLARRTWLQADAGGVRVDHAPPGTRPGLTLEPSQVKQLFVLEVAPRDAKGRLLKPGRKRTRVYALCALVGEGREPRKVVDSLTSVHAAFALEDVARVGLGLAAAPVKGAVGRPG